MEDKEMVFQQLASVVPVFLLGGLDPGSLLSGLDFIELIFGVLNQVTFLVDVFIGAALIGAIVRGIFKNFWKVLWRGVIFLVILGGLYLFAGQVIPYVGTIPIPLKGVVDGTSVEWKNLREMFEGVILAAGNTQGYATAMTDVILKNLVIFLGVPVAAIVTPIVSGLTYPLISLLIPKKMKKLKILTVKLAVSLAFTVIAIIAFAIPMATLVPPMSAIKATIADDTLMKKFLNPELIGFLELFTKERSIIIKVVDLGSIAGSLNIFNTFVDGATTVKLSDALPALFNTINTISYSAPA